MWKVLIADDEPKIRRGLHQQIEQMGLPLEVVCEADDGEMALALAQDHRPDILLVDINMPFISGLDFIAALRQTQQNGKIIVITGYEEFAYAKRALELSVSSYLLKPVSLEELREALVDAINDLASGRARERHYEWAVQQLEARIESLREEFLRAIILGELSGEEIEEQLPYLQMPPIRNMLLTIIKVQPLSSGQDIPYPGMLQFAYADALRGVLEEARSHYLFSDGRGHVLILCDADQGFEEKLLEAVRQAGISLGVGATALAKETDGLEALEEAYDELMEALSSADPGSPAVAQARAFIQQHYQNPVLGLTDVAQAVGIHPSYLSRLMKQELGMSFSKYLTTTRINVALQLMRQGPIKVKSVAEQVGYSTPHYFSTAFKKVLGASPADYRNEEKR